MTTFDKIAGKIKSIIQGIAGFPELEFHEDEAVTVMPHIHWCHFDESDIIAAANGEGDLYARFGLMHSGGQGLGEGEDCILLLSADSLVELDSGNLSIGFLTEANIRRVVETFGPAGFLVRIGSTGYVMPGWSDVDYEDDIRDYDADDWRKLAYKAGMAAAAEGDPATVSMRAVALANLAQAARQLAVIAEEEVSALD